MCADRYGDQMWLDLAVKTIAVHAEIGMRIPSADHSRQEFNPVWLRWVAHDMTLERLNMDRQSYLSRYTHRVDMQKFSGLIERQGVHWFLQGRKFVG